MGASTARRLFSPILVLLLWEAASRASILNPLLVPPPSLVFVDIYDLIVTGELFEALWASLRRVLAGFAIAVVVAIVIGVLMASFRIAEDFVDPLVELIRPVSPLALFPLALLWFGIGDGSKVFLIALSCSFPIILNTYAGVKGIDGALVRAARSLGAGDRQQEQDQTVGWGDTQVGCRKEQADQDDTGQCADQWRGDQAA